MCEMIAQVRHELQNKRNVTHAKIIYFSALNSTVWICCSTILVELFPKLNSLVNQQHTKCSARFVRC